PEVVLITPSTLSKSASTHQKQPPAKVAVAVFCGSLPCPAALATRPRENNKPSPIRRPGAFLVVGRRMRFSGVGAGGWSLPVYTAFCHRRSRQFGLRSCDGGVKPPPFG